MMKTQRTTMPISLYRKYRPQKFQEIIAQDHITKTLISALKNDRISHAYLFSGPKGTGKTTIARLLAKSLNCQNIKGYEPCNRCQSCKDIIEGKNLDLIEIDAASNRGIDEVRELRDKIRYAPNFSKYKVFIIDEVHMLTKEAFNALLKTLEEPPKHAIIILVTTELEKMPMTIISRSQKFNFKKVSVPVVAKKLAEIAKIENIKISSEALELIASSGEGSFRDAESILDQISSNDKDITLEEVEKILGRAGFKKTAEFADLIIKKDLTSALAFLSEMNEKGFNPTQFNKDLIHYFRRLLALRYSAEVKEYFAKEFTESELKTIETQSAKIDPEKTIQLIKSLIEAYTEMRYSPFAIVPLEVAVIENLK